MNAVQYEKISRPFREHPRRIRLLKLLNTSLVALTVAAYPGLLLAQLMRGEHSSLIRNILVPAVSFLIVSVYRNLRNSPRPYESGFNSLVEKKTAGKSFPSRHVFSIFMIAMTIFSANVFAGAVFLLLGCVLAVIRVVEGVHFPKDVLAGALTGILCGILGFYLIP